MQTRISRFTVALAVAAGLTGLVAGCVSTKEGGSKKEQDVSLAELSGPARTTIEKETSGGHVDKITREVERGKTVYDVEATVGGRHMEYLIDAVDGKVLGTEVPIEFSQLPEPVKAATEKYFATRSGLTIMKGVEYGETHYEIEGMKNGKKVEVTFDPSGRPEK
jgi:uncharacterized membrane protein YkoI